MWNEFKAFIMRGNVIDLAVAVVIGAAFSGIVKSLVDDIIMPPIGLVVGHLDFSNLFLVLKDGPKPHDLPYKTVAQAHDAGAVTWNYGSFINNVIAFLIIAASVFILVRMVNRLYAKPAPVTPTTRPCPECTLPIPIPAKRCPNCTAVVG
jgi:large conductance mechanosensitive channel